MRLSSDRKGVAIIFSPPAPRPTTIRKARRKRQSYRRGCRPGRRAALPTPSPVDSGSGHEGFSLPSLASIRWMDACSTIHRPGSTVGIWMWCTARPPTQGHADRGPDPRPRSERCLPPLLPSFALAPLLDSGLVGHVLRCPGPGPGRPAGLHIQARSPP